MEPPIRHEDTRGGDTPNETSTANEAARSPGSSNSALDGLNGHYFVDLESQQHELQPIGRTSSRGSHLSEREVYPDMTDDERQLRRHQTLEELREVYSRRTQREGEIDAPNDGGSLKDIDPELVTW